MNNMPDFSKFDAQDVLLVWQEHFWGLKQIENYKKKWGLDDEIRQRALEEYGE